MVGNDLPTLHKPREHEVFSQPTNVIRVDDKKQSSKWISGPIKVTHHVMVMDFARPYAYPKCTHPIFKKKKRKKKRTLCIKRKVRLDQLAYKSSIISVGLVFPYKRRGV